MFDASVSAVLTALVGALIAAVLSRVLNPIIDIMQQGQFASDPGAQQIINALQVLTGNWLLAAVLSALMVLLARAAVESEVVG